MAIMRLLIVRVAALLCAAACMSIAAQAQPLEVAVKAAFLPKFAPYVTWPLAGAGDSYVICIVGRDPFGSLVDEAAAGQRIDGRPIAVRRLAKVDRTIPCHMAFLAGSPSQSVEEALDALRGVPMLTVTDGRVSRARGIIHFELSGGRVRFHIDDAVAARAGLNISSKLLSLALSVRPRARG